MMTYCRWAAYKQIFDYIPSMNYLQNGMAPARFYTTLRSNHIQSINKIVLPSETQKFRKIQLLKKYLNLSYVCARPLHNYQGIGNKAKRKDKAITELDKLEDYDVFGNTNITEGKEESKLTDKNLIFKDCVTNTDVKHSPVEFENKDYDKLSKIFPHPKGTLNNMKSMLGLEFMEVFHKQRTHMSKTMGKKVRNNQGDWKTTIRITWPETMLFESENKSKSLSENKAAMKIVHWMYMNNHLDEKGYPIHSSKVIKEMKSTINRPVKLQINFKEETTVNDLYKTFTSTVDPFIREASTKLNQKHLPGIVPQDLFATDCEELVDSDLDKSHGRNIHTLKLSSEVEQFDPIYNRASKDKDEKWMKERNIYLKHKLEMITPETHLPITEYKDLILKTVNENRAMVIRGAPGCGKSTRTPSYILNDWISKGVGADCNIIVSQPRRVAALSLATRVAQERGDRVVGDTVGHQVRLATRMPRSPGGGILYCTAGALLRRLASSSSLPGCTHLILDEAHERSADCDAVMTLAKRAMELNPILKVIVMSATIDTQLFSRYYNNCPILDIPGFTFPVESFYLNDLKRESRLQLVRTTDNTRMDAERALVDYREVVQVLRWINKTKPEGAILVFLPGWETIKKVKEEMESHFNDGSWVVLPVHSRLSNEDQRKIFDKPMEGIRKIVLATNIAETSITIDDVVYVVDTGIHKEHRLLEAKGISSLDADWVSKASVAQRRGRAGRVKPGECYHLYTEEKMQTFADNNAPEILRIPLEKTVLDCKTYNEDSKALDFLGQFPQPPSVGAIKMAVEDLIEMGALDKDEHLTPLGRRIASYTTHPKISKALVHSTIFKVTSPVADLSAIISNNIDLHSCAVQNRNSTRRMKSKFHPTSDHMALYWLCQHFDEMRNKKTYSEIFNYCKRNYLRGERINSVFDLRKICIEHLKQSRMLPQYLDEASHKLGEDDLYATVDELVKGVMLSGLNTLLFTKYIVKTRGKLTKEKTLLSDQGQKAFLGQSSVNHSITKTDMDAFLLYCGAVHSQERRGLLVRDVSLIHPLTVFLFSQKVNLVSQKDGKANFTINKSRINMECDEDQATCLLKLREMMWKTVQYYIENKGFSKEYDPRSRRDQMRHNAARRMDKEQDEYIQAEYEDSQSDNPVDNFRHSLMYFVAELLNKIEITSHPSLNKDKEITSHPSLDKDKDFTSHPSLDEDKDS